MNESPLKATATAVLTGSLFDDIFRLLGLEAPDAVQILFGVIVGGYAHILASSSIKQENTTTKTSRASLGVFVGLLVSSGMAEWLPVIGTPGVIVICGIAGYAASQTLETATKRWLQYLEGPKRPISPESPLPESKDE